MCAMVCISRPQHLKEKRTHIKKASLKLELETVFLLTVDRTSGKLARILKVFFLKLCLFLISMYECLPAYIYVHHLCPQRSKMALDLLELWIVMSHHIGALS